MTSPVPTLVGLSQGTEPSALPDPHRQHPHTPEHPTDSTLTTFELIEIGNELAELAVDRQMALRMPWSDQWLMEIGQQQRSLRARSAHLRREFTPDHARTHQSRNDHP
jgi:hypothetical protein